jgi:hypothetical protein
MCESRESACITWLLPPPPACLRRPARPAAAAGQAGAAGQLGQRRAAAAARIAAERPKGATGRTLLGGSRRGAAISHQRPPPLTCGSAIPAGLDGAGRDHLRRGRVVRTDNRDCGAAAGYDQDADAGYTGESRPLDALGRPRCIRAGGVAWSVSRRATPATGRLVDAERAIRCLRRRELSDEEGGPASASGTRHL